MELVKLELSLLDRFVPVFHCESAVLFFFSLLFLTHSLSLSLSLSLNIGLAFYAQIMSWLKWTWFNRSRSEWKRKKTNCWHSFPKREWETERMCMSVCVCVWERELVCVSKRERERGDFSLSKLCSVWKPNQPTFASMRFIAQLALRICDLASLETPTELRSSTTWNN